MVGPTSAPPPPLLLLTVVHQPSHPSPLHIYVVSPRVLSTSTRVRIHTAHPTGLSANVPPVIADLSRRV